MWMPCQAMAVLCRCSAKESTAFTVQAEMNMQATEHDRASSKIPSWLQPSHSARESQARLSIHITLIESCVLVRTLKWLYNSKKKVFVYEATCRSLPSCR